MQSLGYTTIIVQYNPLYITIYDPIYNYFNAFLSSFNNGLSMPRTPPSAIEYSRILPIEDVSDGGDNGIPS